MIGRLLNGRYRIEAVVGSGGMATVYLGQDVRLQRRVAIKVMRPDLADDPTFLERFGHEARAAAALSHPNVVGIFDVGQEGEVPYLVLEYVEGRTLKEIARAEAPLPPERLVFLGRQLCAAVAHAHAHGIVHRDLKPQNVLVDAHDHLKVTDFGIASHRDLPGVTQPGLVMGTVQYQSPEQARGEPATELSDVYSLGVVLYELATGRLPFLGPTADVVQRQHLQDPPIPPGRLNPVLPRPLEDVILAALAKDPARRPESARALAEALERALAFPSERTVPVPAAGPHGASAPATTAGRPGVRSGATPPRGAPPTRAAVAAGSGRGQVVPRAPRRRSRVAPLLLYLALVLLVLLGTAGVAVALLNRSGGGPAPTPPPGGSPTPAPPSPAGSPGAFAAATVPGLLAPTTPTGSPTLPTATATLGVEVTLSPSATATARASASPSATPTATATPAASASPTPPSPTVTASPSATGTATPTPSPTATRTARPSPTATATASPSPRPSATPSPTHAPTATPSPVPSPTASRTPTRPPSPTPPPATPTPAVEVPDLVGLSLNRARATLQDAGLRAGNLTFRDDPGPPNRVLAQEPAAGTRVRPNSAVSLVISRGGRLTVPMLQGLKLAEALAVLADYDLRASVTYIQTDALAPDVVQEQSPKAGEPISSGATVNLIVSRPLSSSHLSPGEAPPVNEARALPGAARREGGPLATPTVSTGRPAPART